MGSNQEAMEVDTNETSNSPAVPRRTGNAIRRNVLPKNLNSRKSKQASNPTDDRISRFGKIFCWETKILGQGSTSIVYDGYYEEESERVAVKSISKKYFLCYDREIDALRALVKRGADGAVHLVRYIATEETDQRFYIAIEYCDENLETYIKERKQDLSDDKATKIIYDICRGINAMHRGSRRNPIVHRDLKPSNILLQMTENQEYIIKVSDFGISKILANATSGTTEAAGTFDWMSPSCLRARDALDRGIDEPYHASLKDDIFSLGMNISYIMTRGQHPFGTTTQRLTNISSGNHLLRENITPQNYIWKHLVQAMLHMEETKRPTIVDVLNHPFFWNADRIIRFITECSNTLKSGKKNSDCINKLQACFKFICKCADGWKSHLCEKVTLFQEKQRKKYHPKSFESLIEFIRDKYEHRSEWDDNLDDPLAFGKTCHTYIKYFVNRFPLLLIILFVHTQKIPSLNVDQLGFEYEFKPDQLGLKFDCSSF